MALVKKGSRLITVDGTTYRWRLRGRPTYDQGLAMSPLTYAVEHAQIPGTTLVITTNQPHPNNWLGTAGSPVLPAHVADSIRTALTDGWTPQTPGSPFRLDQSAGFIASRRRDSGGPLTTAPVADASAGDTPTAREHAVQRMTST
ncbi:hypothetical protein ACFV2Q_10380 [Streptomyces sp. NPDC059650]|uniref:hypothetical protein n=1 Tax=Streptomyces sp. NPDC059650 TaxID=3346896 RepID=UPI0036C11C19